MKMKTWLTCVCLCLVPGLASAQTTTTYKMPTVYELTGHFCGYRSNDPASVVRSNDGTIQTGLVFGWTYCSLGGRGGNSIYFAGCASVEWDEVGNMLSYTILKEESSRSQVPSSWCFGP
jgi:hypothetical protein